MGIILQRDEAVLLFLPDSTAYHRTLRKVWDTGRT